ncbi:MAG: hypothetical protein IM638_03635 [Bacteroidetes bacterium]|nr:hypothetical protein [Bacteroidota bacterium]
MKQAILITAYKEIDSLLDLINLLGSDFNFYIHIDKKSKIDFSILYKIKNVFVSNSYKVNWGGLNHLKAILLLSVESLKNEDNSFFHLITGEDFPSKSTDSFLSLDTSKNYLEYFEMPAACWAGNGGLDRINYFQLYDVFDAKKNKQKAYINKIVSLQKKLNLKRSYSDKFPEKLYGGSTYWSLNRDALNYVVNYSNKELLKRLKFTFCAEEIYFQTILLNSPFANTIVSNNLRYIDWSSGRGGYPAYLDESDFDRIISSDNYFARKVKSDSKLKRLLTAVYHNGG